MRFLITGSRIWKNVEQIEETLKLLTDSTPGYPSIFHGACPEGADAIADAWARRNSIPVEKYPADWENLGKAAGPIRNEAMVRQHFDMAVAFLSPGRSPGTRHTMSLVIRAGKPLRVIHERERPEEDVPRQSTRKIDPS